MVKEEKVYIVTYWTWNNTRKSIVVKTKRTAELFAKERDDFWTNVICPNSPNLNTPRMLGRKSKITKTELYNL